jgi:hypothetical protein
MKHVTTTLKLKFQDLNGVKAAMFAETVDASTELANELLRVPVAERKKLTTTTVVTPLKSALSNQVIRGFAGFVYRARVFHAFISSDARLR